ncbi:hypothetical protein RIF29_38147 [Crotalaria pallida]|uniref:Ribosomal protein eL8/eL30/eS12/Gadd45 domain-containing protein n=1 Tax=Crotalaria pallida TaxID=3830 RepID=A0AAN9DZ32_CROPI
MHFGLIFPSKMMDTCQFVSRWMNPVETMPSTTSAKTPKKKGKNSTSNSDSLGNNCYEGERLTKLLQLIQREIKSAKHLDGSSLPEKIWLKQQFSIGVNDVTRVLERMEPCTELRRSSQFLPLISSNLKTPTVKLQAVLVASDCNPRWLTKHLPTLSLSRRVPLIFVRDNKQGSLRLGELVKLKTTIAVGIKDRGNTINKLFEGILQGDEFKVELDGPNSAFMPGDYQDPERNGDILPQEQVNAGLIASDRVDNSELHPLVVDSNVVKDQTSNKDTVPISGFVAAASVTTSKEQEWQTVTRRRAQLQKASGVVSNKGVEGGGSDPSNG